MTESLVTPNSLSAGMVIPGSDREGILDSARRIEAAGLDSIWVGDHISFYIPIMESLTLLSFVAGVTSRVRLCTGVYLMPLRHPTTTAKVIYRAYELGANFLYVGLDANVLEITPPLTVSETEIAEGLDIIDRALGDAAQGAVPDEAVQAFMNW